jgi:type IV secretion system protein VirB2
MRPKQPGVDRATWAACWVVVLVAFVCVHPAFADSSLPWETPMQIVLNALTGTTGTLLASLAVAAVGVMALAGRISWSLAGSVLFGIACLFGCVRIVAIFNG